MLEDPNEVLSLINPDLAFSFSLTLLFFPSPLRALISLAYGLVGF